MGCGGMLFPAMRRIVVNAPECGARQRFMIAQELGHCVCQGLEGTAQPVYCRADKVDDLRVSSSAKQTPLRLSC